MQPVSAGADLENLYVPVVGAVWLHRSVQLVQLLSEHFKRDRERHIEIHAPENEMGRRAFC